ncbi:MAG: dihydroorotate dehydrogenase-like protein [Bacteroidales bacterium]|nr:dihydroorotate dehydrogenase-like protein [Bacteroidales bacterium]
MIDLSTKYMGLELRNPLIASSSALTGNIENIVKLNNVGIGAIVIKSLFEEQIIMDIDSQRTNNMYGSYDDVENYVGFYTKKHKLDQYLNLLTEAKNKTNIPIIASINCISDSEWIEFASDIEKTGIDALELNMFIMPTDSNFSGRDIEQNYLNIVNKITKQTRLPIALKISPYFSGMANFANLLSHLGIASLVLFNRFYRPDVDLEKMKLTGSKDIFSTPQENANVLRWLGILSDEINCDVAANTGIWDAPTVLKNIAVGANAVQMASVLFKQGIEVVEDMLNNIENLMKKHNYSSIKDLKGVLSKQKAAKPMIYERAQFMKYFSDIK